MKLPGIRFDKEATVGFLINHGEKIIGVSVGVLALWLVYGGIDAIRSQSVVKEQQPASIESKSTSTAAHIESVKKPPVNVLAKNVSLKKLIEPWRTPKITATPEVSLLDKPLFEERSKRTQPAVLPIEQLRAVAGVVVLAAKAKEVAPPQPDRNADRDVEPGPTRKPTRARSGRGRADAEGAQGVSLPPGGEPMGQNNAVRGRIAGYVIVTGLIPMAKQEGEYRQRFESAGFRDPKRDSPLWSDYLVERSETAAGEPDAWNKMDLKQIARQSQEEWAGTQENPPTIFLLPESTAAAPAAGSPSALGSTGSSYCAPLPQLIAGEAWGTQAMHPWFIAYLKQKKRASEDASGATPPEPTPESSPTNKGIEYRLFRFVDMNVEPGKSYRYRVRLSIWNPNFNLAAQHLSESTLAKAAKLVSTQSNVSLPVVVPESTSMLVRSLRKEAMKRLKPGMIELLVLAPNSQTGNYSLRSLVTEVGGLANIDQSLNKPGDSRVRGEDIATNHVLVDMRGRQDDRADTRTKASPAPPEPFEMLFLRTDGSFEKATAADSQVRINQYIGTLPPTEETTKGSIRDRPGQPEMPQENLNPFQSK